MTVTVREREKKEGRQSSRAEERRGRWEIERRLRVKEREKGNNRKGVKKRWAERKRSNKRE